MCDLCPEPKESSSAIDLARSRKRDLAKAFQSLAGLYEGISRGEIGPHEEVIQKYRLEAGMALKAIADQFL